MENIEEKNRQAEQEPKQTDGFLHCLDFLSRRKSMTGQQLCKTACDGDTAKVCTLLREHLMELERERQQRARAGLLEVEPEVEELLFTQSAQSFINYQDAHGATPLHSAA